MLNLTHEAVFATPLQCLLKPIWDKKSLRLIASCLGSKPIQSLLRHCGSVSSMSFRGIRTQPKSNRWFRMSWGLGHGAGAGTGCGEIDLKHWARSRSCGRHSAGFALVRLERRAPTITGFFCWPTRWYTKATGNAYFRTNIQTATCAGSAIQSPMSHPQLLTSSSNLPKAMRRAPRQPIRHHSSPVIERDLGHSGLNGAVMMITHGLARSVDYVRASSSVFGFARRLAKSRWQSA